MAQFGGWLRGRTPKQRARQARHLEHPVRATITIGAMWGVLFWVIGPRSFDPIWLVLLPITSLGFGVAMVWIMRRDVRREASHSES